MVTLLVPLVEPLSLVLQWEGGVASWKGHGTSESENSGWSPSSDSTWLYILE